MDQGPREILLKCGAPPPVEVTRPRAASFPSFRIRQANIVGSSAMSAPSRLIQTLQAAPDTPPSNLTLLSATQTSLRFNWKIRHRHGGPVGYLRRMLMGFYLHAPAELG
ncbi:Protein sidekick-2 [Liparis tanakae]|uniref:Protein sidekick-2 n=1 Tax=Liparis tanakae TaxID=230148 RepID=A0A4Z2E948_9TELE|nr:Protein sidekick-2 [Liparis tanakae]